MEVCVLVAASLHGMMNLGEQMYVITGNVTSNSESGAEDGSAAGCMYDALPEQAFARFTLPVAGLSGHLCAVLRLFDLSEEHSCTILRRQCIRFG